MNKPVNQYGLSSSRELAELLKEQTGKKETETAEIVFQMDQRHSLERNRMLRDLVVNWFSVIFWEDFDSSLVNVFDLSASNIIVGKQRNGDLKAVVGPVLRLARAK